MDDNASGQIGRPSSDSSRHGGVQPGGPPGGSAPLHGAHAPGRLSRPFEPAAGTTADRKPWSLPGHLTGQWTRKSRQALTVLWANAQVPVLYFLRVQQSVSGVLSSHQPVVPGHPHRRGKLPSHPLQQVCWYPHLLPEAPLHPADRQWSESLHISWDGHSKSLELESGQQDLLLSDGLLPL